MGALGTLALSSGITVSITNLAVKCKVVYNVELDAHSVKQELEMTNSKSSTGRDIGALIFVLAFLVFICAIGFSPGAYKASEEAWQARLDVCPLSADEAYSKWGGESAAGWSKISRDTWSYSGAKVAVRVPEDVTYEVSGKSIEAGLNGETLITSQLTLQCRVDR